MEAMEEVLTGTATILSVTATIVDSRRYCDFARPLITAAVSAVIAAAAAGKRYTPSPLRRLAQVDGFSDD